MERRIFLQTVAAGALGTLAPTAFANQAKVEKKRPAPTIAFNLEGIGHDGKLVNLDDYAGKACLVSFFTVDCIPCIEDTRRMREFFVGNKARNFMMIGVSMDQKKSDYTEYMTLLNSTIPAEARYPIVWRKAPEHRDSFGPIAKTPTHFVLNRAHKQVLRRDGVFQPDDWDDLWTSLS